MAASRFVLFLTFLSLIFNCIASMEPPELVVDAEVDSAVPKAQDPDASLRVELDQHKSKIDLLESNIKERTQELTSKENTIEELQKTIEEKSNSLASLESQIKLLQDKLSLSEKEQEGNVHSRGSELEEQINNLKKKIEERNKENDALAAQVNIMEKKIQDLNVQFEDLHRTNDGQKSKLRKTQRELEVAEEELMKAKMETLSISKQLAEVHEAWIPAWLAMHFVHFQSFVVTNWNKHGRPALELTKEKVFEKKLELEKWIKPHIDTFKTKWMPIIKDHWLAFVDDFGLHVQSLTTIAINKYHATKKSVESHVLRLQEVMNPYFQDAKKLSKPYVDQVSSLTKPHVDKALVFLKPYTQKVHHSYREFMRKAGLYHRQIQVIVLDALKDNEFTRPLAIEELVWFMASALMALPVIVVLNMVSAAFREILLYIVSHGLYIGRSFKDIDGVYKWVTISQHETQKEGSKYPVKPCSS